MKLTERLRADYGRLFGTCIMRENRTGDKTSEAFKRETGYYLHGDSRSD